MIVSAGQDDFARQVHCILGAPVDNITMDGLVDQIFQAAASHSRLFISTPNLNFLMLSQRDPEFRRSLLESDICPADGVGVLLICRLLGAPITSRVSGADLPAALQVSPCHSGRRPLSSTFFGGEPGVGKLACKAVNGGNTDRLICAAAIDPGVMTSGKMSDLTIVERINATEADFLLVALGAQKGQIWLLRNLETLKVPIVSHLGATLNFLAGTIRRAPVRIRKLGLEWLWRIKEEPRLAPRYLSDGVQLLWIVLTRIAPLGLWLRWNRGGHIAQSPDVGVITDGSNRTRIIVKGSALDDRLASVVAAFRNAVLGGSSIILDLSDLQFFETGFAGHILMLEKAAQKQSQSLTIVGGSPGVARALKWCGLKHLIGKSEPK